MSVTPMEEYLAKIGAIVDTDSFNKAMSEIGKAKEYFDKLVNKAEALNEQHRRQILRLKGIAFLGGLAGAAGATANFIKKTADAEMQYKRLGVQMWITSDSAKALSVAMKTMGVSEQDLAWIPELRDQFFRLRNEMDELATPVDASDQLKKIRSIGYEIQSLQVKVKTLQEWVVYFLVKYLAPMIAEFQSFVKWLNDKLGSQMPKIARKISKVLSDIVGIAYSAIKALRAVMGSIIDFVKELPANVKKWAAIFSLVGAAISAGPFGKFMISLGTILLLVQDFVYYMKGWNSSKTLAPMWQKLLDFLNSDKLARMKDTISGFLGTVADFLDKVLQKVREIWKAISDNIDWDEVKEEVESAANEVADAFIKLGKAVANFFEYLNQQIGSTNLKKYNTFWKLVGGFVQAGITAVTSFVSIFSKLVMALAQLFNGDPKAAALTLSKAVSQASTLPIVLTGIMVEAAGAKEAGRAMKGMGMLGGMISLPGLISGNTAQAMQMLISAGLTPAGAAGLIGNLMAESHLDPKRVQDDFDPEYASKVDQGIISREDFANDGRGFGIAQWTDSGRKAALYDFIKGKGGSIADFGLQLAFLVQELQSNYSGVYKKLTTTNSVREASDAVLHDYEAPADQSESVEESRASNGQQAMGSAGAPSMGLLGSGSMPMLGGLGTTQTDTGSGADLFSGFPGSFANAVASDSDWDKQAAGTMTVGVVKIVVSKTNATAQEIYEAFKNGMNAKVQQEVIP